MNPIVLACPRAYRQAKPTSLGTRYGVAVEETCFSIYEPAFEAAVP